MHIREGSGGKERARIATGDMIKQTQTVRKQLASVGMTPSGEPRRLAQCLASESNESLQKDEHRRRQEHNRAEKQDLITKNRLPGIQCMFIERC